MPEFTAELTAGALENFAAWLPSVAKQLLSQQSDIDKLMTDQSTQDAALRARLAEAENDAANKVNELKELREQFNAKSARIADLVDKNQKLTARVAELEAKLKEYPDHPEVKAARRAALEKKQKEIADELKTITGG